LASAIAIPDTSRGHRQKRRINWGTVGRHAVLMFFSLSVLLPLAWVIIRSIISLPDGTHNPIWPQNWADPWYQHYEWILKRRPEIRTNFRNSVYVSLLTVVTTTITSVLAGYALVHLRTPFKRVLTAVLVASLFFPTRVTAITGIFEVQRQLGFINKTWTLVFPYTALNVAICIFIMRGVFETVSKEILDAARVDGAGSLRLLLGILLPIIKNGIVVDYQTTRDQVAWLTPITGRKTSHGTSYAESWADVQFQRMPNVSLLPGERDLKLDDLIAATDNGIYIVGRGSYSIDQQRYNFQFGGQVFYEVKGGKITGMLKDVAYQSRTPDFWNAMDMIGGKSSYQMNGTFTDGKGQPGQSNAVSHGTPPARFKGINVINTGREVSRG